MGKLIAALAILGLKVMIIFKACARFTSRSSCSRILKLLATVYLSDDISCFITSQPSQIYAGCARSARWLVSQHCIYPCGWPRSYVGRGWRSHAEAQGEHRRRCAVNCMNPHILYIHIVYLVFVSAFVVLHSWRLRDFKLRINARLLSRSVGLVHW